MTRPASMTTFIGAQNYASSLVTLKRFKEAKSLLRESRPLARRILGEADITLRMGKIYARALFGDPDATLDDFREAVTTLEEIERTARRVFGGAHPLTSAIKQDLQTSRELLDARETQPPSPGNA